MANIGKQEDEAFTTKNKRTKLQYQCIFLFFFEGYIILFHIREDYINFYLLCGLNQIITQCNFQVHHVKRMNAPINSSSPSLSPSPLPPPPPPSLSSLPPSLPSFLPPFLPPFGCGIVSSRHPELLQLAWKHQERRHWRKGIQGRRILEVS